MRDKWQSVFLGLILVSRMESCSGGSAMFDEAREGRV